jgi:putative sugar O-methyltransferase
VKNIDSNGIYKKINSAIEALGDFKKNLTGKDEVGDWSSRDERNIELLRDGSNALNSENLENFRGKQIYVSDYPSVTFKNIYFKNKLFYKIMSFINVFIGSRRGEIKIIQNQIDFIKKNGVYDVLMQNSDTCIGNPMHYKYDSIKITGRYLRHVYFYNIFKNYIANDLQDNFVALDIGSSYGIFSALIKSNNPSTRHILVDLEGQMILAEYYLSRKFPSAKIANAKDIIENGVIDSNFINKYDFILVPVDLFDLLLDAEVDLVTNFLSLGEMSRYWFDKYINSKVFKSAKFLFTVNRYDSAPTYSNKLTVLDYPFQNYMTVRMKNCSFFKVYVEGVLFFFYRLKPHTSGVFEFIGRKKW